MACRSASGLPGLGLKHETSWYVSVAVPQFRGLFKYIRARACAATAAIDLSPTGRGAVAGGASVGSVAAFLRLLEYSTGQQLPPAFEHCVCEVLNEDAHWRWLAAGIAVGIALGPAIDTIALLRRSWRRFVARAARFALEPEPRRPAALYGA